MLNTNDIHDIQDLAQFVFDESNDAEARADIIDLFGQIGIDPRNPSYYYGHVVVPEPAFTEYAMDLAERLGYVEDPYAWPSVYIDWDVAAEGLKHEYIACVVNGVTFYFK